MKISVKKAINIELSNAGFSLIEILVASTIASLMMIMLYTSYKSILSSIKITTAQSEFYENINLALRRFDMDISNLYYTRENKNVYLYGAEENKNSIIVFVTVNHNPYMLQGNIKKQTFSSDVKRVAYYLKRDNITKDLYNLIKREENHYSAESDAVPTENIILENVVSLKFYYKMRSDWTDKWDSRQDNLVPDAVKTNIVVKNYDKKNEKFEMISIANISME